MFCMTRTIPPTLAPILEQLELERPTIVSVEHLEQVRAQTGVRTPLHLVVQRLAARGWLLPSGVRGVWEFAPAERAGPYSEGDALLALRAATATTEHPPFAAALGSALWLLDIVERAPETPEVAIPPGIRVPAAIRRHYRVVRYAARLAPIEIRDVPVHRAATVLVHLAHRPTSVRSWASVLEHLGDLIAAAPTSEIEEELEGRPHATRARLAYLVSGVAPALAEALAVAAAGVVWFGPRRAMRRYDARWNIADTILPLPPAELGRAARREAP
jgi:hypothetical protein